MLRTAKEQQFIRHLTQSDAFFYCSTYAVHSGFKEQAQAYYCQSGDNSLKLR